MWFCVLKLSEKVLDINDLSGTVTPLERDDKEETKEEEGAKTKKAEAPKRFAADFILLRLSCIVFLSGLTKNLKLILEALLIELLPTSQTNSAVFILTVISAVKLLLVKIVRHQAFLCKGPDTPNPHRRPRGDRH